MIAIVHHNYGEGNLASVLLSPDASGDRDWEKETTIEDAIRIAISESDKVKIIITKETN